MEEARSGVASLPRLRPERPRPLLGPRGHHDSEGWRSCFLGSSRETAMFHWRSNPESRGHGSAAAPLSRDSLPRFPSWKPPRSLALHGEQGRDWTGFGMGFGMGRSGPGSPQPLCAGAEQTQPPPVAPAGNAALTVPPLAAAPGHPRSVSPARGRARVPRGSRADLTGGRQRRCQAHELPTSPGEGTPLPLLTARASPPPVLS